MKPTPEPVFFTPRGYPMPAVLEAFPDLFMRSDIDGEDFVAFTSGGNAYAIGVDADGYTVAVLRDFVRYHAEDEDRIALGLPEPALSVWFIAEAWNGRTGRMTRWHWGDLIEGVLAFDAVHEWTNLGDIGPVALGDWVREHVLGLRLEESVPEAVS